MKPALSGVFPKEISMHHMMYQDEPLRIIHIADSHNQYCSLKVILKLRMDRCKIMREL